MQTMDTMKLTCCDVKDAAIPGPRRKLHMI
eukprot:SAG31_NODE_43344_length_267_cov_0.928571_1_plen_29_part_01